MAKTMRVRTPPGKILLEEFMKPIGLSGSALARQLMVPANSINDIVRGRRGISADTALRLAR
jgi:addiction module HigA family antidote